jgi:hypothetical protein
VAARKGAPRPDLRPRWASVWYGVRQRLGLSRPALAELLGYSPWSVKRWETDPRSAPPRRARLLYQHVADNIAAKTRRVR